MLRRPSSLRDWVVIVFAVIGIGLLPWTLWLSQSLQPRHFTNRWDLAWSGFDSALAIVFLATAIAAYRRSLWTGTLAASLGTLLVTDAWFDVVLDSHGDAQRSAITLALVAELPMAAFCFWIAYRSERFLAKALHLAPTGERPTEGDLVGVLEISADREPAGEPRDADASA
jgi:hypothetical protein